MPLARQNILFLLCLVASVKADSVNFAEVFIVRDYIGDFVVLHKLYIQCVVAVNAIVFYCVD